MGHPHDLIMSGILAEFKNYTVFSHSHHQRMLSVMSAFVCMYTCVPVCVKCGVACIVASHPGTEVRGYVHR